MCRVCKLCIGNTSQKANGGGRANALAKKAESQHLECDISICTSCFGRSCNFKKGRI